MTKTHPGTRSVTTLHLLVESRPVRTRPATPLDAYRRWGLFIGL